MWCLCKKDRLAPPKGPVLVRKVADNSVELHWEQADNNSKDHVGVEYVVEKRELGATKWKQVGKTRKASIEMSQEEANSCDQVAIVAKNRMGCSEPMILTGISQSVNRLQIGEQACLNPHYVVEDLEEQQDFYFKLKNTSSNTGEGVQSSIGGSSDSTTESMVKKIVTFKLPGEKLEEEKMSRQKISMGGKTMTRQERHMEWRKRIKNSCSEEESELDIQDGKGEISFMKQFLINSHNSAPVEEMKKGIPVLIQNVIVESRPDQLVGLSEDCQFASTTTNTSKSDAENRMNRVHPVLCSTEETPLENLKQCTTDSGQSQTPINIPIQILDTDKIIVESAVNLFEKVKVKPSSTEAHKLTPTINTDLAQGIHVSTVSVGSKAKSHSQSIGERMACNWTNVKDDLVNPIRPTMSAKTFLNSLAKERINIEELPVITEEKRYEEHNSMVIIEEADDKEGHSILNDRVSVVELTDDFDGEKEANDDDIGPFNKRFKMWRPSISIVEEVPEYLEKSSKPLEDTLDKVTVSSNNEPLTVAELCVMAENTDKMAGTSHITNVEEGTKCSPSEVFIYQANVQQPQAYRKIPIQIIKKEETTLKQGMSQSDDQDTIMKVAEGGGKIKRNRPGSIKSRSSFKSKANMAALEVQEAKTPSSQELESMTDPELLNKVQNKIDQSVLYCQDNEDISLARKVSVPLIPPKALAKENPNIKLDPKTEQELLEAREKAARKAMGLVRSTSTTERAFGLPLQITTTVTTENELSSKVVINNSSIEARPVLVEHVFLPCTSNVNNVHVYVNAKLDGKNKENAFPFLQGKPILGDKHPQTNQEEVSNTQEEDLALDLAGENKQVSHDDKPSTKAKLMTKMKKLKSKLMPKSKKISQEKPDVHKMMGKGQKTAAADELLLLQSNDEVSKANNTQNELDVSFEFEKNQMGDKNTSRLKLQVTSSVKALGPLHSSEVTVQDINKTEKQNVKPMEEGFTVSSTSCSRVQGRIIPIQIITEMSSDSENDDAYEGQSTYILETPESNEPFKFLQQKVKNDLVTIQHLDDEPYDTEMQHLEDNQSCTVVTGGNQSTKNEQVTLTESKSSPEPREIKEELMMEIEKSAFESSAEDTIYDDHKKDKLSTVAKVEKPSDDAKLVKKASEDLAGTQVVVAHEGYKSTQLGLKKLQAVIETYQRAVLLQRDDYFFRVWHHLTTTLFKKVHFQ